MSREQDQETLENFFNCVKEQNYEKIEEAYKAVEIMPECNSYDDQYHTYWKAYYIDERILPTEDNVDFHPYIKGYFDMAVMEHMRWRGNPEDMHKLERLDSSPDYDGSRELVAFLKNYRYLKDTMAQQGKEIFRPLAFDKYPFLEDFVKGVFRDDYDRITQDASQCKTIQDLIKNKDAVEKYCATGIHMYNQTEYGRNIEKNYNTWCKERKKEIYRSAEDETFRQGNIAALSDEEKKFIIDNSVEQDRIIEIGKTVDNATLDSWKIFPGDKADIMYARAEKPEDLSDKDKKFILQYASSEEFRESVAKVFDFKAQSPEDLKNILMTNRGKKIGKDIAKAYIDSVKGDVAYGSLLSKYLTKDEFEQVVEDYKITAYRRENERLNVENRQIKQEMEQARKDIAEREEKITSGKSKLEEEQTQFQRYVDYKSEELKAKSEKLGFVKDIPIVCQGAQKEVDAFTPERKKELFDKMKKEMTANANLRENHLTGMCKIYVSKTNTPEEKAKYFEELHNIRKSGKTNAEKREMARTFGRVLERNPDLANDEALKGLAKVDYSAVGYTPTKRGFTKNAKDSLEK